MKETTQLYQHIRLDTGEIFYIGIGQGKRPWSKQNRNTYWHNIVNKAGYRVEILEKRLSWYQACELEKMLIALHGRHDLGYGPLANMTDGGDGVLGLKHSHSPETRAKMSAVKLGKTRSPFSPETKAKMRAAKLGKAHSPEHRANMSATKLRYYETKRIQQNNQN
jgi:hypothetical protein